MHLPKLKFHKKQPKLSALHKQVFDPNHFWSLSLTIFIVVALIGSLLGFQFFRSVYAENYRNENTVVTETVASMNVGVLERAIEKRTKLINEEIPLPPDPSR